MISDSQMKDLRKHLEAATSKDRNTNMRTKVLKHMTTRDDRISEAKMIIVLLASNR